MTIIRDRLSQAVFWWFILFMCFVMIFFLLFHFVSSFAPFVSCAFACVYDYTYSLFVKTVSMVRLFTFKCPIQSRNNPNQSKWILFSHRLRYVYKTIGWIGGVCESSCRWYILFGILLGMLFVVVAVLLYLYVCFVHSVLFALRFSTVWFLALFHTHHSMPFCKKKLELHIVGIGLTTLLH